MMIERPEESEYHAFYKGYVEAVGERNVIDVLQNQLAKLESLPDLVEPSLEQHRYAPDKWSVREVIGHLIDAERVFGYRAFCISRGDQTPLPGFDESFYVEHGSKDERSLRSLVDELSTVRRSNLHIYLNLPPGSANMSGDANGSPVSVRALAFMTAGHFDHHLRVLEERYGIGMKGE